MNLKDEFYSDEFYSHEYAIMPNQITSKNMFDGWQYYQTTEHMLGITDMNVSLFSGGAHKEKHYKNSFIDCKIVWSELKYHKHNDTIFSIEIEGRKFYSCDGNIKKIEKLKELSFVEELICSYDFERLLFKKIYNR